MSLSAPNLNSKDMVVILAPKNARNAHHVWGSTPDGWKTLLRSVGEKNSVTVVLERCKCKDDESIVAVMRDRIDGVKKLYSAARKLEYERSTLRFLSSSSTDWPDQWKVVGLLDDTNSNSCVDGCLRFVDPDTEGGDISDLLCAEWRPALDVVTECHEVQRKPLNSQHNVAVELWTDFSNQVADSAGADASLLVRRALNSLLAHLGTLDTTDPVTAQFVGADKHRRSVQGCAMVKQEITSLSLAFFWRSTSETVLRYTLCWVSMDMLDQNLTALAATSSCALVLNFEAIAKLLEVQLQPQPQPQTMSLSASAIMNQFEGHDEPQSSDKDQQLPDPLDSLKDICDD
jgi:hypothetical protein